MRTPVRSRLTLLFAALCASGAAWAAGPVSASSRATPPPGGIPVQLSGQAPALQESVQVIHEPADSVLAGQVREALRTMAPLPGMPDMRLDSLEVVLVRDTAAYREASGGAPPEWSAGVAIPSQGRIVLPSWPGAQAIRPGSGALLRHEWAHVALYRAAGGRRAPRWFSEGYAEWAGGWDRTRAWRLRVLLALGRAPTLDSLSLAWPADRAPAESAYLLSASVVEYLVEASGEVGLEALFLAWRRDGRFETALRSTYGVTTGQLENDWQRWARDRYGWLFVLTHSSLAWGILALALTATAFFRRRHNRDRMARLRARELPEAPVFWDPSRARAPSEPGDLPALDAGTNTDSRPHPGVGTKPDPHSDSHGDGGTNPAPDPDPDAQR